MAGETNNEAYVSTGKPKVGGAVFVGATSLTPPTDAVTALPAGFAGMGYVSEDGVTQSQEVNSEEVKAWGGDTVLVTEDDKSETWKLTFIEMMNINVLKEIYGATNVTGTLAAGISIASGTEAHRHSQGRYHRDRRRRVQRHGSGRIPGHDQGNQRRDRQVSLRVHQGRLERNLMRSGGTDHDTCETELRL